MQTTSVELQRQKKRQRGAKIAAFSQAELAAYCLEEAQAKRESKAISEQLKRSKADALERAEELIALRDIAYGIQDDVLQEFEEPNDQADDEDNDYEI